MLTRERLEKEIKANDESILKLEQIREDSIYGIELNKIITKAFENALVHIE